MNSLLGVVLATIVGSSITVSQNTSINWSALDMGFASAVSPTITVSSVAGQVIIGPTRSAIEHIESGFLVGLSFDTSGTGGGTGYILYSRTGTAGGTIWMRAVDGSFDTQIDTGSWPRLSHDGRYILFHKGAASNPANRDMCFYDLQTGGDTVLFHNSGDFIVSFDWFDDDYHIVFDYSCGVMMMNRDGTGLTTLYQSSCYDDAPVARPGSWGIAHHNSFQGIILTDSLGINRHVLPGTGGGNYWPAWSPDGQWISLGEVSPTSDSLYNYYKIRPDGTGLTALTSYLASDPARFWAGGAWSRDGRYLLVPGTVNGINGIYAIATDSSRTVSRIPTTPGDPIDFVGSVTGNISVLASVPQHEGQQLPSTFRMEQNYPNPFNPTTTIEYQLPTRGHVTLTIYNILGQETAVLVDGIQEAGFRSVVWNADHLASGVYFYQMVVTSESGSFKTLRKMIVMK